ncbi:MAG: orotidine-5'-phosphate decarboxylase [Bacteroidia bacterium]
MNRQELIQQIKAKQSYLCVGLDTDLQKIPKHLLKEADPVLAFNKAIIEATQSYAVAYKINTAFYEAMGADGWRVMEETLASIPDSCFTIADAKRGDIGNTSNQYARAFFETLKFDSITLAPYMGKDSIEPFFTYPGKWGIVLALTSNPGSADFEQQTIGNQRLYEMVIDRVVSYTTPENLMFVVGATKPEELGAIRQRIPQHFMLVPGVGAQGGDLHSLSRQGLNKDCGLLVNASRSILYASGGEDFSEAASREAAVLAGQMSALLKEAGIS